jgi:hypothetical protein
MSSVSDTKRMSCLASTIQLVCSHVDDLVYKPSLVSKVDPCNINNIINITI